MENQDIKSPSALQEASTSQLFTKDPLEQMTTKGATQKPTGLLSPNVVGTPPQPLMLSQLTPLLQVTQFSYMHHQKQMNGLKVPQKETRPVSNGHSIQECSRSSASCQPQRHAEKEGLDCPWLGCKTSYETISDFLNHVNREHVLNRNSLLEIRVQVLK